MSFIEQILEEREFQKEMEGYGIELDVMENDLKKLREKAKQLNEGPTDFSDDMSVGEIFDEAQKRMNTARWAFGLTNKLKDPEDRKKHRRNFMIVMNKLRALINKLIQKLTTEDEPETSQDQSRVQSARPVTQDELRNRAQNR